jgi:glutamate/aspartate transport system substrate-binding protein
VRLDHEQRRAPAEGRLHRAALRHRRALPGARRFGDRDLQASRARSWCRRPERRRSRRSSQANKERLLGITVVEAPDHARAVEMVEKGEADGFAMDDVLLYGLRAGRPDPNKLKVVGKFLTVEALAIMLSKDDPEFKQIVDDEMKRLVVEPRGARALRALVHAPIPPKNAPLNIPMTYLLKDLWKYPTDWGPG